MRLRIQGFEQLQTFGFSWLGRVRSFGFRSGEKGLGFGIVQGYRF